MVSKARKHIAAGQPRFEVSPRQQSHVVEQFLESVNSGDVEGLLAVLDQDTTWVSDGGGAPGIARKPIHGAENVVRFVLNLARQTPEKSEMRPAELTAARPCLLIGHSVTFPVTFSRRSVNIMVPESCDGIK